jgi:hypothetical protein
MPFFYYHKEDSEGSEILQGLLAQKNIMIPTDWPPAGIFPYLFARISRGRAVLR